MKFILEPMQSNISFIPHKSQPELLQLFANVINPKLHHSLMSTMREKSILRWWSTAYELWPRGGSMNRSFLRRLGGEGGWRLSRSWRKRCKLGPIRYGLMTVEHGTGRGYLISALWTVWKASLLGVGEEWLCGPVSGDKMKGWSFHG